MIKTYFPTGGKMKAEPVKKGFLPKKKEAGSIGSQTKMHYLCNARKMLKHIT